MTEECALAIRSAVTEASGNEVFFIGKVRSGVVGEVTVAARGNDYSVPALTHMTEPGGVVIHNHPGGDLTPSEADLSIEFHNFLSTDSDNLGSLIRFNPSQCRQHQQACDDLAAMRFQDRQQSDFINIVSQVKRKLLS